MAGRPTKGEAALRNALKDGPVMVCQGGPLDRRWYTEAGWSALADSETRMLPVEDREPVVTLYRRTKDFAANHVIIGLQGSVYRWGGPTPPKPQRSPY
jgi:hypothetical protein